jgi:hypothetical protein
MHLAIYFLRKEVMELARSSTLWKKLGHAPKKSRFIAGLVLPSRFIVQARNAVVSLIPEILGFSDKYLNNPHSKTSLNLAPRLSALQEMNWPRPV